MVVLISKLIYVILVDKGMAKKNTTVTYLL